MVNADVQMPGGRAESRGHERREHTRIDAEFDVTVQSETNFYVGFCEDVSVSGIFVATYALRTVGELMLIQFALPGIEEKQLALCEVRWVRVHNPVSDVEPGMGLRFVDLTPETRALVERFVAKRAPLFYDDEV